MNNFINNLNDIDLDASKKIYNIFNKSKLLKYIPNILGLIPYEIYVIPGMYISILQVLWLNTPNPVQFHLLPHWFAFSFFTLIKTSISRKRPGCFNSDMSEFIDSKHCSPESKFQSFPSAHSGIAMALATALFMEMNFSENPKIFEIKIENKTTQKIISVTCIILALNIGIHRISKGYHSLFDVIIGYIFGFAIGFISWIILEYYKKLYHTACKDAENNKNKNKTKTCDEYESNKKEGLYWYKKFKFLTYNDSTNDFINITMVLTRIILTIPIVLFMIKFFVKDIFKLATIKH